MTEAEASALPCRQRGGRAGPCACCGRDVALSFHHLIPKKMHRRTRFKKMYSKQALDAGIYVCARCHRGIHKCYDEMTLAKRFNSLEQLLQDDALVRHFQWVAKQKQVTR